MTRYAKTMSQALAEVQVRELKMNDPKLMKVFDKLKPRDTVKIKHSSTLERGKDFIEYTVRSKNTLRNGVEKITLARKDSPTSVKRFLYKRDNKITFAVGDMAASIDDIKEEVIDEIVVEEVELDEAVKYQFVAIDRLGKVIGFASSENDAKDMARRGHTMDSPSKGKGVVGRNKAKVVKLKKPMSDKQGDMMINRDFDMNKFGGETTYSIGLKEEVELDEGTWAIPETPAQKRDLKRLMSKPLPLGKEGDNAADKMYSIIGDDELFDDLYVAGKKDPKGDARPIIKKAMKRLKIKEEVELDEAKEVLSRFRDDKLKKSIMNLATQKGLKVKEMGDKLEVSGNAKKVMDLTLAVQKHDVKIEQNIMSAYTAAITKQLGVR